MTYFTVTKNGKEVSTDLYDWNEEAKIFSTNECGLDIDFSGINGLNFKTGSYCSFKTGSECIFDTGYICSFKTGSECTFDTGPSCTFDTGSFCIFKTGSYCSFKTGSDCLFKTGSSCTFESSSNCTFDTGSECTFKTGYDCVIVRRDVFEVIQPKSGIKIKINLNKALESRFVEVKPHIITISGKDIEISEESYFKLKESLK